MGSQLVVCTMPNHPKAKRGDVESIYQSGTISYGPGYEEDKKLILELDNIEPEQLLQLVEELNPKIRIDPEDEKMEVENKIKDDPEEWTKIKDKSKNRANIEKLLGDDIKINYLKTATKDQIIAELISIGEPCIYKQLDELRI